MILIQTGLELAAIITLLFMGIRELSPSYCCPSHLYLGILDVERQLNVSHFSKKLTLLNALTRNILEENLYKIFQFVKQNNEHIRCQIY
jgi:hypothetical protein